MVKNITLLEDNDLKEIYPLIKESMDYINYDYMRDIKDLINSVKSRKKGKKYSFEEHLKALILALLSNHRWGDNNIRENMETIEATKQKFKNYRDTVKKRAKELEDENINVKKLSKEDEDKLNNLKIIETYLNRGIDEHQKILNSHFDLKILYEKELELLAQMSLIQRFSLRNELYDKVLEDASKLEELDVFLRPLFYKAPEKIYNINKSMELQRPIRRKELDEEEEIIEFDEEEWQAELAKKQREKLAKYEKSLSYILDVAIKKNSVTLEEIKDAVQEDGALLQTLIPSIDIFKEIMVELKKSKEVDFVALRKEKSEDITEQSLEF